MLSHLYISPLEKCNLNCQMCYTRKTPHILSNETILDFIKHYQQALNKAPQPTTTNKQLATLKVITFCGGEVFALADFPELINHLTNDGIFCQIITNGTIDRLKEFKQPNLVNLIASLDGLPEYHDKNRGRGNFQKSLVFLQKAKSMGFHFEIFSIVTKQNYPQISQFEKFIFAQLGETQITYHPRKPRSYLDLHPQHNINSKTPGFDFLSSDQLTELMNQKTTFPPRQLGCYLMSLMSDGNIYACCEGIRPLGTINDNLSDIIRRFEERRKICAACCEPDFRCGLQNLI